MELSFGNPRSAAVLTTLASDSKAVQLRYEPGDSIVLRSQQ